MSADLTATTAAPGTAPPSPARSRRKAWRYLAVWAARTGLENKLAVALTLVAIMLGGATYFQLTRDPALGGDATTLLWLLNADLAILLLLGVLIARKIVGLWSGRRRGRAGAKLHSRMVLTFSLLAVAPAILMAGFSAAFYFIGVQAWFGERIATAVNEAEAVAQAYLNEHNDTIRADALAMANDINRDAPRLIGNPQRLTSILRTQAMLRDLTETAVIDGSGRIIASGGLALALEADPVAVARIDEARRGAAVVAPSNLGDRVRAVVQLDRFVDSFLVAGRPVDPRVLGHMQVTEQAVQEYADLRLSAVDLQISMALIFVVVAILLLLAAVWIGIMFAEALVRPISSLIEAAEQVRGGDLSARVPEQPKQDELAQLSRAFNRMTRQLGEQRAELIDANRQLDERRQFIEAILAGVSSGVCRLDEAGRIQTANQRAAELLERRKDELPGLAIDALGPEFASLLPGARLTPGQAIEAQIVQPDPQRGARRYLIRLAAQPHDEGGGFVMTFDDVSELVSAQRKAAWADVARRIAHEMKNPLTPIQLSAERLKRKYLTQISDDTDTFRLCVDTIVRQVGSIRQMVDEFSSFARMPAPVMAPVDLSELADQAVFLQRQANPGIGYEIVGADEPIGAMCDSRQIGQALINLLQNAAEAIARQDRGVAGRIQLGLARAGDSVMITVRDNGCGLPEGERHRLTEPYVTTRVDGTGLGLAIVRRIMDEHAGRLELQDAPDDGNGPAGGAMVRLILPQAETGRAVQREVQADVA